MQTLRNLCLTSPNGEAFSPDRLTEIERALVESDKSDMPWYLRIIVGIGAWLASLFFLGFAIVLIGWHDLHRHTMGICGIVLLILSVIAGRQKWGVFVGQCLLAVSLASQAMIYFGFLPDAHLFRTAMILSIALAIVLYVTYPDFLSRLLTCFAALQLTLFYIYAGESFDLFTDNLRVRPEFSGLVVLYWMAHLVAICGCFLWLRYSSYLAPLGYAVAASLTAWQLEALSNMWSHSYEVTYSSIWFAWVFYHFRLICLAAVIFGLAVWAAGGISIARQHIRPFLGGALALATLIGLGAGGVLLALLFLLLGFSLQNKPVLGLGLILFPIFLIHYYYSLHVDLLAKAGVLIGSGIVLLLLRAYVQQHLPLKPQEAA